MMRRIFPLIVLLTSVFAALDARAVTLRLEDFEAQQNPLAGPGTNAQTGQTAQTQPSSPQKAAPASPEPQPPPQRGLLRTEILNFDNWTVTCQEFADTPKKHACNAQLRAEQSGSNQMILVWTMYFNDSKQLVGVVQIPTGVMIAPGVEVTLGDTPTRKFGYESCDPSRCIATLSLDSKFIHDASGAPAATVNIQAIDGKKVQINFPIKGFEKAYAQLKANAS